MRISIRDQKKSKNTKAFLTLRNIPGTAYMNMICLQYTRYEARGSVLVYMNIYTDVDEDEVLPAGIVYSVWYIHKISRSRRLRPVSYKSYVADILYT